MDDRDEWWERFREIRKNNMSSSDFLSLSLSLPLSFFLSLFHKETWELCLWALLYFSSSVPRLLFVLFEWF